jgi:hypothetical protein
MPSPSRVTAEGTRTNAESYNTAACSTRSARLKGESTSPAEGVPSSSISGVRVIASARESSSHPASEQVAQVRPHSSSKPSVILRLVLVHARIKLPPSLWVRENGVGLADLRWVKRVQSQVQDGRTGNDEPP